MKQYQCQPAHESVSLQLKPKQVRLAQRINEDVKGILKHGGKEVEVLTGLNSYMALLKELMVSASCAEMVLLCERYDGFYKYIQILEAVASCSSSVKRPIPTLMM
ncbi:MAG: hypothetical protein HRT38_04500 [Alteromonadaceae bacterium]|nr:hypothetical protein [Alteromonadaceae bacterium]